MGYFDMNNDEADLTPEQEAEEAFNEWLGWWLDDLANDGYVEGLDREGLEHQVEAP